MSRRNISLPDELDERARHAGLNVSALAREAILAELDRQDRMVRLDAWLDELDAEHGPPPAEAAAAAKAWAESGVPVLSMDLRHRFQKAPERRRAKRAAPTSGSGPKPRAGVS